MQADWLTAAGGGATHTCPTKLHGLHGDSKKAEGRLTGQLTNPCTPNQHGGRAALKVDTPGRVLGLYCMHPTSEILGKDSPLQSTGSP